MSIYDTLLGTVGQGYAQANQNAMAQAQMPTFADRFLAGLRQNTEDEYKRRMGESTLAMNQTYKLSQEQNMSESQQNSLLNKQTALINAASKDLNPDNRAGWAKLFVAHGIPEEMLPSQQFRDSETINYSPSTAPQAMPDMGLAEGGEETRVETPGTERIAIPGTGYGTGAWQQIQERENKWDIANLRSDQQMYLASLKRLDPKSAAGKIEADRAAGFFDRDPGFYDQMKFRMGFTANPQGPAYVAMGEKAPVGLGPRGGWGQVAPGAVLPSTSGGGESGAPAGGFNFPENLNPKGRQQFAQTAIAATMAIGQAEQLVRDARNLKTDKGLVLGTGLTGKAADLLPLGTDAGAFQNKVATLAGQIMIDELVNHIKAANATLGQLSDKEGQVLRGLRGTLEAGKLKPAAMRAVLEEIAQRTERIIGYAKMAYGIKVQAINPGASTELPAVPNVNVPSDSAEVKEYRMEDGTIQKWSKRGGVWAQVK